MIRRLLTASLSDNPGLDLFRFAANGKRAVPNILNGKPVVLMNVDAPCDSGVEVVTLRGSGAGAPTLWIRTGTAPSHGAKRGADGDV